MRVVLSDNFELRACDGFSQKRIGNLCVLAFQVDHHGEDVDYNQPADRPSEGKHGADLLVNTGQGERNGCNYDIQEHQVLCLCLLALPEYVEQVRP